MVSDYKLKPWLSLYDDHAPTEFSPTASDALEMFRSTVSRAPDSPLVHYFKRTFTGGEVDALSDALAVQLGHLGVSHGQRVALYLQNNPQFVFSVVAAWKLGAIVVPINPMLRQRELSYILNDCGATVLITLDSLYASVVVDVVAETAVNRVITTSELDYLDGQTPTLLSPSSRQTFDTTLDFATLVDASLGQRPPGIQIAADDVAFLPYTSGTTGPPKGAMVTHANVVYNSEGLSSWYDLHADDGIVAMAPLFHITGLIVHLTLAFVGPYPLLLSHKFDPVTTAELIEHHQATLAVAAITAFIAFMNTDSVTAEQLSSLRRVISGGAPVAPAHIVAFRERFGHEIISAYGLTETTAPSHVTPVSRASRIDESTATLSIGVPFYGVDVQVVDEAGNSVECGETGELAISGPMVVPGYWNKPEESEHAFRDGTLYTGDVGFMDAEGWFYIVDRKKDMIVASGYKVWPREVEDVLYMHEAVREAAVVGVADEYRGETVKAFVSLRSQMVVTESDLIDHCRTQLAAYKRPHSIAFLDELPKTASGKILRRELRQVRS